MKYAIVMSALLLMPTAVSAQTADTVIGDVYLTLSDSPTPASAPTGYDKIGQWDVDRGGGLGTGSQKGNYMAGLFVKRVSSQSSAVHDVYLTTSESEAVRAAPVGYKPIGHWDVDGYAQASDGIQGHHMTGLFIKTDGDDKCVVKDLRTTASDNASWPNEVVGYRLVGFWDVGSGGSGGSDGSKGQGMMGLYVNQVCGK